MTEHLLDNIYQVGGGSITHELDGASYLIYNGEAPNDSILIDCGSPLGYSNLEKQLDSFNISINSLKTVLATHSHYDHIAAASQMHNATVFIHPYDRVAVESRDPGLTAAFLYDKDFPHIPNIEDLHLNEQFTVNDTVIVPIHTPGHTPGSVSYKVMTKSGENLLIAGDAIWGGYSPRINSDAVAWYETLENLSQDNFDYISFGHGANRLIPNAMAHIALARESFLKSFEPSHEGKYFNPWFSGQT